jgi:hypothetical protein
MGSADFLEAVDGAAVIGCMSREGDRSGNGANVAGAKGARARAQCLCSLRNFS